MHASGLCERFHDAFQAMGEPGIPIDRMFMASPEFPALLQRLRSYAQQHDRDHWWARYLLMLPDGIMWGAPPL